MRFILHWSLNTGHYARRTPYSPLFNGLSKMPECKAPEVLRREAYWSYVDRRRMKEMQQAVIFDKPLPVDAF